VRVIAMSDTALIPAKILPVHHGRDAYVYVRSNDLSVLVLGDKASP